MATWINKYKKNEFVRNFTFLFTGTLGAQIINIIISPFLTRLYGPSDFGIYGFYISICTLLIVFVTGRYEFAINTTENDSEAAILYRIVNLFSVVITIVLFILLLFCNDIVIKIFELNSFNYIYIYIPVTLVIMGFLQSSNYILNRYKEFKSLSIAKFFQSIGNGFFSILFGLINSGSMGLIASNIFGLLLSNMYQKRKAKKQNYLQYDSDLNLISEKLKKYKHYPIYNSPSAFFDALSLQAPVFIFMKFFSESIVGYFNLTTRVVGLPVSLISNSIAQVFLSQVSVLNNEGKSYKNVLIKVIKILFLIGLFPTLILVLFAPNLFTVAFGNEWSVAGSYARILAFSYFVKFVVSPLSMVFFISQRVRLLSIIQLLRAVSTLIVLLIGSLNLNIHGAIYLYTIHEIVFYLIYLYFILKISK